MLVVYVLLTNGSYRPPYTLDRRLRHFDIQYNDKNVSVEEVKDAVKKELEGPGKLLGYRAMHREVRQVHDLNVPRDLVHAATYDLDPKEWGVRKK